MEAKDLRFVVGKFRTNAGKRDKKMKNECNFDIRYVKICISPLFVCYDSLCDICSDIQEKAGQKRTQNAMKHFSNSKKENICTEFTFEVFIKIHWLTYL